MDCKDARDAMSWVLDGLVTVDKRNELAKHLQHCPGCRGEWKLMLSIHYALRDSQRVPLPYDLTGIVTERIRAKERERVLRTAGSWRWRTITAIPLLLAAILVAGLWQSTNVPLREADYLSAHITRALAETGSVDTTPVSVALLGAYYASDEQ